jgi:predicted P-loop ATPase
LKPNGRLVLTFRDFSQELAGIDRFIPVRADDQRIMTCVLEYETDSVLVTDLIHVRDGERWNLQKSSYRKLRLSPSTQIAELERTGFTIDHNGAGNRMHTICARK